MNQQNLMNIKKANDIDEAFTTLEDIQKELRKVNKEINAG